MTLRIANCSGFFGDRMSAAKEMVQGGPIDVLTGDWLAELTMFILHKTKEKSGGYARTFLTQIEEVLPTCLERTIKVVSNAGGLDPRALGVAICELAARLGVAVKVAVITGDDITNRITELRQDGEEWINLDTGEHLGTQTTFVTANAYLGGAPIAAALAGGAQVVITGRVTDASLVTGPAMAEFGWGLGDTNAIAGAVVAGHVIECGAQCCGGNYSFFDDISGMDHVGFPIAELEADGSCVITKHEGTGGAVTIETVTAQLLYEIAGTKYLSPDAIARFDTIQLEDCGVDRVKIHGVKGEPPPTTLKVTANLLAGFRNAMTLVIYGTTVEKKASLAKEAVWSALKSAGGTCALQCEELFGDTSGDGTALLRLSVRDTDREKAGRAFSSAVVETLLASYPGAFGTTGPSSPNQVARYWPTLVRANKVRPQVEMSENGDGDEIFWVPLNLETRGSKEK